MLAENLYLYYLVLGLFGWTVIIFSLQLRLSLFVWQPLKSWLWLILITLLLSYTNKALLAPVQPNDYYGKGMTKLWQETALAATALEPSVSLAGPWLIELWLSVEQQKLLAFIYNNAFEEFGRFGILILLLFFGKLLKVRSFRYAQLFIAFWFSLSHPYNVNLPGLTFIPAHFLAFVISLILIEIGVRYGVIAAYLCHILTNYINLTIVFHASSYLVWINVLCALIAFMICFYILWKIPVSPNWLKIQTF